MIWPNTATNLFDSVGDTERTIGIMGGTFDPIHIGHLYCAEQALSSCNLDAVIFMPAGTPSFKRDLKLADVSDRLEMCKLAIESNARFYLSDVEAHTQGITFTVDTLNELRQTYGRNIKWQFIIGTDLLMTLHKWRSAEMLAQLCGFICVSRSNIAQSEEIVQACARLEKMGFRVQMVEAPLLDISSSEIRARIAKGKTIRYLVPLAVCEYIYAKGLYGALNNNQLQVRKNFER